MKNKKLVYVALSADILHEGHINILKIASKFGKVVVGLLTDNAISEYKKIPLLSFSQRKKVIENLKKLTKDNYSIRRSEFVGPVVG